MTGLLPTPMLSAYSASKHAIVELSTALRIEAKRLGVNVSVACPGLVDTSIHERTEYLSARGEDFLAQLPRQLMVTPDAAARAILRGVVRNEAVIIHPWYVRIGWWLHRLSPALMSSLMQHSVTQFRKVRLENERCERSTLRPREAIERKGGSRPHSTFCIRCLNAEGTLSKTVSLLRWCIVWKATL